MDPPMYIGGLPEKVVVVIASLYTTKPLSPVFVSLSGLYPCAESPVVTCACLTLVRPMQPLFTVFDSDFDPNPNRPTLNPVPIPISIPTSIPTLRLRFSLARFGELGFSGIRAGGLDYNWRAGSDLASG